MVLLFEVLQETLQHSDYVGGLEESSVGCWIDRPHGSRECCARSCPSTALVAGSHPVTYLQSCLLAGMHRSVGLGKTGDTGVIWISCKRAGVFKMQELSAGKTCPVRKL